MARHIRIGLTIDPIGTDVEIQRLCALLNKKRIRATVTVVGRIGQRVVSRIAYLRPFLEAGHELANHTHSHPPRIGYMEKAEQEKEILLQHQRLIELGREWGRDFQVQGFRAPLYAYDESIFEALKKCGYLWDSSCIYSPLLGVAFSPFKKQNMVEIPVLFPDDVTMIERMLLPPERMYPIWWKSYEASEKYFVWAIHPYGVAKSEKMLSMLEEFLNALEKDDGEFLTLSEIAAELQPRL